MFRDELAFYIISFFSLFVWAIDNSMWKVDVTAQHQDDDRITKYFIGGFYVWEIVMISFIFW